MWIYLYDFKLKKYHTAVCFYLALYLVQLLRCSIPFASINKHGVEHRIIMMKLAQTIERIQSPQVILVIVS